LDSSVNGIAYQVEGDGPPVVLVHSGVADRRMWDDVAALLSASHTVIRHDMRGFGASPPPTAGFRHLDDLVALLDTLGVDRAVVAGNSRGGKLALDLAGAVPDRITRLVLLAPPISGWDWSDALRAYAGAEEEALVAGDIDRALQLNLDMWVRGPARPWSPGLTALADRVRAPMSTALANQLATEELELPDGPGPEGSGAVEDRLGKLAMPVVVGVGDRDLPDFVGIARRLAAEIPGAQLVEFPGAGHLLPLEHPQRVAAMVAAAT
jgi:3-oxoadipate enol-lactonase